MVSINPDANEETFLLRRSPTFELDEDSTKVLLVEQKHVYTAITLADIFQKIVFTTIITSFLVFASSFLGYGHVQLLQIYFVFTSVLWLTTAFANIFVDYVWFRRYAIIIAFFIYFVGLAILTGLTSHMLEWRLSKLIIIIPLYLVCVGEGVCKSFIGEFGRYQFEDARLSEQLKSFTNILYWVGNTCAFFLVLFFLAVCELYDFELGFGLCCVCIAAGMLSFGIGWKSFREPIETKMTGFRLLFDIFSNAKVVRNDAKRSEFDTLQRTVHWLDYAMLANGGKYSQSEVEEAKYFIKMIGIYFSLVPYWVCNAQGYSTFIFQGFHLNLSIARNISVPISWTALFNIAAVLMFLKLTEKYLYPSLRRNGYSFPVSWRVIVGMVFVFLSMCGAGTIQLYAQSYASTSELHQIGKVNVTYVREVHILYTIPQYVLLGISEVLVGLTVLTLGCKMCPKVFKKLVTSLYYLMIALGHMISLALLCIGWFPSQTFLDGYEMVIYFFSLGAASIFGILMYVIAISERTSKENSILV